MKMSICCACGLRGDVGRDRRCSGCRLVARLIAESASQCPSPSESYACIQCAAIFDADPRGRHRLRRCPPCARQRELELGRARGKARPLSSRKNAVPCASCGELLYGGATSLPAGSRRCRPCRRAAWSDAERTCPICTTGFRPWATSARRGLDATCSRSCARKRDAQRRRTNPDFELPDRSILQRLNFNARGRMVTEATGATYEYVDRRRVYIRDKWTCGICGDGIDATLRWPNQMCASGDHIVSLSAGGDHTYANIQAAHWLCNVYKRADADVDFRLSVGTAV